MLARGVAGGGLHHSRLAYVGPASTTSERQPDRNTGNALISACFSSGDWSCLMHALSSQISGSFRPSPRRASWLHARSCVCLAAPSSDQEWLTNPLTAPRLASAVFS